MKDGFTNALTYICLFFKKNNNNVCTAFLDFEGMVKSYSWASMWLAKLVCIVAPTKPGSGFSEEDPDELQEGRSGNSESPQNLRVSLRSMAHGP